MIGRLTGTVVEKGRDSIVLMCNGVGFEIAVSDFTMRELSLEQDVQLYTKMIVREDSLSMAGFYTREEKELFELLTSVSKVGTKVGLSILSSYDINTIKTAILKGDAVLLSKVPGIGKKTAERLILELKDKISPLEVSQEEEMQASSDETDDVLLALIGLGFSRAEALKAIRTIALKQPNLTAQAMIPKALALLSKA
ncbi:MAG: Holliday junction branch migration protein RuvA [Filifactor alocis]|nr:Holliday junction branch migration protein RuvA [Filifactor alocis]